MKSSILAAALAAAVFLPVGASAQSLLDRLQPRSAEAKAADTCESKNLDKTWLFTFQKKAVPVLCVFSVNTKGRLTDGACAIKTIAASETVKGDLEISEGCSVQGTVKISGMGEFALIARMAGDKSTMAGALLDSVGGDFFPLAVTRWPPVD